LPAALAGAGNGEIEPHVLEALALVALEQGDRAEARRVLERVVAVKPDNGFALLNLGNLLLIAGSPDAAAERYRQALAVNPEDHSAALKLADLLLHLHPRRHRTEADRLLRRVIRAQPDGALAATAKGARRKFQLA
jgi:Tfp pilus assembly protein PilF